MAETIVSVVVKTQQSALRRLDKALKGSEKNAQKLQRFLDTPLKNAFSGLAGSAESAATRIDKAFRRANITVKKLGREVKNAGKNAANSKFTKGALAGGAFSGLPGSGLAQGIGAGLLVGGPKGAIAAGLTITTVGLAKLAKNAAITSSEVKRLEIALSNVAGADTAKALNTIRGAVDDFNAPIDEATKNFTQLLASTTASGFDVEDTAKVFRGLSAANKALAGDSEKLNGIILATTQVFSKGKVTAEELRGQIGEKLPGAVALFAEATGRTTAELDKALEQGEVSLEDFVLFTEKLLKKYEKDAETIAKSPTEAGRRLNTALTDLNVSVGKELDELGGRFQDFATEAIRALTRVFNFLSGLGGAIEAKLGGLPVDAIENAEERLKRSQEGVQGALGIILDPKSTNTQIENAKQGLAIFTQGAEKAKKDLDVLKGLTSETIKPPKVEDTEDPKKPPKRTGGGSTPRVRESQVPELTRELSVSDQLLENSRQLAEAQFNENRMAIMKAKIDRINIELTGRIAEINALAIPQAEKDLRIKLAQNDALEERQDLEVEAATNARNRERSLKSLIQGEKDQLDLLKGRLNGNEQEVQDRIRIRDLAKQFVEQGLDPAKAQAQAEALVNGQRALQGQLAAAAKLDALYKGIGSTIENGIIGAIDAGIESLINGTKDLGKALQEIASGVLKDIGRQLISFGVNGLLKSTNLPFFADGGRPEVGKPAIVGEKGPEIFVPDTAGTVIPNDAFSEARNALVDVSARPVDVAEEAEAFAVAAGALARNSQFITSQSREREVERTFQEQMATAGTSQPMNIRFDSRVINSVEYVTAEQFQQGIVQTAKQTKAQVFADMKNRPLVRRSLGM